MPDYRGSLLWSKPLYCPPSARTGVVGHNIDRCISSVSIDPDKSKVAQLKEFEKIIHKELAMNEVNVATGKLAHVQKWLKNDYEPAVQSGSNCRKLHSMLEEKINFLQEDVLSIVYKQKEFEKIGLKTFLTAAAVHLAILQEMAVRDPDENSPQASLARYAPEYAQHAIRVAKELVKDRQDQVKVKHDVWSMPVGGYAGAWNKSFKWVDEITGQENGRYCMGSNLQYAEDEEENVGMVQRWCKEHKDKVADQLLSDLGQPLVIASKWRELEEKPIN